MINLDKGEHLKKEEVCFTDDDFTKININGIKENQRIFIPYDELPDSDEQRSAYLESLLSFIERKTGKLCSYFLVNETEPYEMSGFYIQTAPELRDCHGNYIANDGYVYDRKNIKWHVLYYYRNNAPYIILDNDMNDFQVVKSLSEFSSLSAHLIPVHSDLQECNTADEDNLTVEIKKDCNKDFNIGAVIATVLVGLVGIVIVVLIYTGLSEAVNELLSELSDIPKETANTPTGDETDLISAFKDVRGILKGIFPKILLTSLVLTGFSFCFKMIKRLLNGDRF